MKPLSIDGLWRDRNRKALVRVHNSRFIPKGMEHGGYRAHIAFVEGWATSIYGKRRDVVMFSSVIPKRTYAISVGGWHPMGEEYRVIIFVVQPVDDFGEDTVLTLDVLEMSLGAFSQRIPE